jgi:hypothetical protein
MARFSSRSWNNCATCNFWQGPRKLHAPMGAADVEAGAQGACARKQEKLHWRPTTYATNSCSLWREWASIEARDSNVPA